jgi:hypothetical protein
VLVGPSRSWPLSEDSWPTVPFLNCTRDVLVGDLARQQKQHQRMKQEMGAMSGKQEDYIGGPQTNSQVGGREASSRDFHRVAESE